MKKRSALCISLVAFAVFSAGVQAQSLHRLPISPDDGGWSTPPVRTVKIPPGAITEHKEAPLFIGLGILIGELSSAIGSENASRISFVASELGVTTDDALPLLHALEAFRTIQANNTRSKLEEVCAPVLRRGLSQDESRLSLGYLYDRDASNAAALETVLSRVGRDFGNGVASKVSDGIRKLSQGTVYREIDVVKLVELALDGDFSQYLLNECQSA